MQLVARELYYGNKLPLRKNCILCTVIQPPWCNVNTGTTVASSKWLGLIKIIAQVVLGQQVLHTLGCIQLLVPTTLNITLDIVSTSEL